MKPTRDALPWEKAPRELTRRDFMNAVLIGSAGLATGTRLSGSGGNPEMRVKGDAPDLCHGLTKGKKWNVPPPSGELYDCIIIGGGPSGLAAAWKLRQIKYDNILLLEKNENSGGFCRDDSSGGQFYSIGSAYTGYPANDDLIALYADLGVVSGRNKRGKPIIADRYLPKSLADKDYVEGAWYTDAWDSGIDNLPFPKKLRQDLKEFRKSLRYWYNYVGTDGREGFAVPTDQSSRDAKARALDALTLKEYIASNGWDLKISAFFDSFIRSSMGSTHDRISAWAAISFLSGEFAFGPGDRMPGKSSEQDTSTLAQPGGDGYLSRLLTDRIGTERIRTGAFVVRAINSGDEVHLTYLETEAPKTARARTVIYAAPRYMAHHLLPDLAAARGDEAGVFHYAPYIVANVHVSRTPAGAVWVNSAHGDFFLTDFILADWAGLADPLKAPLARPNVLTVYAPMVMPGQRAELLTKPADYFEERILSDLERILPGVRPTVTGFDLYRWGHAMLSADKGFVFSQVRIDAAKPLGRLFFANTDVEGLPTFENAVMSAIRAATEVDRIIGAATK